MQRTRLFIWCSITLVIGLLIGYFSTQYVFFEVVYKMDVIYTSISLSTLLIGFYIAVVINRKTTNKRIEKDLLIKRLNEIKDQIQLIGSELEKEKELSKLALYFKSASKYLSSFEKILSFCCDNTFKNESNKLRNQLLDYKRKSTGGSAINNAFQITAPLKYKLELIHDNLLLEIDFLILKINKI